MSLERISAEMLPAIEKELRNQIQRLDQPATHQFYEMLAYHMGWVGTGPTEKAGKRIRPLLVLLCTGSCGDQWLRAIPAAAAVEILHNFSLVHDDIQDNSSTRRGRPTVWKQYGLPMAINVGDAMFAISNLAVMDTAARNSADVAVRVASALHAACLDLTRGQYLDMSYQNRADLTVEDYWPMIEGKTAALISVATKIGALLSDADAGTVDQYALFGHRLGLAFQVQDDILGIWGDEKTTGKSAASDLIEGKNSLPILYSLGQGGQFAQRWAEGPIRPDEVQQLAEMLVNEGAYSYSQEQASRLTQEALQALEDARPQGDAGTALEELAHKLLQRES